MQWQKSTSGQEGYAKRGKEDFMYFSLFLIEQFHIELDIDNKVGFGLARIFRLLSIWFIYRNMEKKKKRTLPYLFYFQSEPHCFQENDDLEISLAICSYSLLVLKGHHVCIYKYVVMKRDILHFV